jgi:tRNA nucleotidyltransferase/poly(A) polymerase
MKMYEVGGYVRDQILGVKSKDVDFSVVLDKGDLFKMDKAFYGRPAPFDYMVSELKNMGFEVFKESPEHLTVRAKFPRGNENSRMYYMWKGSGYENLTADFVLARKEGTYSDGRRPDSVKPGTLEDDLARRDFTMNAIAKDYEGNLIDPFNGQADIDAGIIRAVGDPLERLTEDALRAVRALRFSVTKGFDIDPSLDDAMREGTVKTAIRDNISDERIQVELSKMFRYDTVASLRTLSLYPALTRAMFAGSVSLDATMKTKGRGK